MFSANIYLPVFLAIVTILTLIMSNQLKRKSAYRILHSHQKNSIIFAFALAVMLSLFLGSRPQGYQFGDTGNYVFVFENMRRGITIGDHEAEWVWYKLMELCLYFTDAQGFLTIVDLLYIGFTVIACYILLPKYGYASLLFNLAALSFFTYGTNGIRNGLGCSLMLVAISIYTLQGFKRYSAIILAFFAYNIHHSTLLPFGMMIVSMFFVKNFKWAYSFWICSIVISLVLGNSISSFFASLGFDDRLSYLTTQQNVGEFSHSGFRFDFLFYSMMPIVLGYYIIIKKSIRNTTYELLLNTYTLTNAFWVMVIRANFSNRFAYLSWFLYPIVLAYPLFKLNIWDDKQGKKVSQIMLAQLGFTLFMDIIYW